MNYEVGKFYRVPTVYAEWDGLFSHWPIIGPWHEDAELVPHFSAWHYHFDFRFMREAMTPEQDKELEAIINEVDVLMR